MDLPHPSRSSPGRRLAEIRKGSISRRHGVGLTPYRKVSLGDAPSDRPGRPRARAETPGAQGIGLRARAPRILALTASRSIDDDAPRREGHHASVAHVIGVMGMQLEAPYYGQYVQCRLYLYNVCSVYIQRFLRKRT